MKTLSAQNPTHRLAVSFLLATIIALVAAALLPLAGAQLLGILIILALTFHVGVELLLRTRELENRVIIHSQHIIDTTYRETESLINLIQFVKPRAPLCGLRGYASSPDMLLHLYRIIREQQPAHILELGSGFSTLIAAYAMEHLSQSKLTSLDHSEHYAALTRHNLDLHKLKQDIDIRYAPLEPTRINSTTYTWYSTQSIQSLSADSIDLLLIDGPPQQCGPNARLPALQHLGPLLKSGATVIFDDANRPDERHIIEQWQQAFPRATLTWLPSEKGLAVLTL